MVAQSGGIGIPNRCAASFACATVLSSILWAYSWPARADSEFASAVVLDERLVSPTMDFSDATSVALSFSLTWRSMDLVDTLSLMAQVGDNEPIEVFTAHTFLPELAFVDRWTVDLSAVARQADVRFMFEFTGASGGSLLAVDNVSVDIAGISADVLEPDDRSLLAVPIAIDRALVRSISPGSDVDWYRFTVEEEHDVNIRISQPGGILQVHLMDVDGLPIDDAVSLGEFRPAFIARSLSPGTYFVIVSALVPNLIVPEYTITLADGSPDILRGAENYHEPNDGPENATPISLDDPQVHTIDSDTDVDWITFTLDVGIQVEITTSGESGDTTLTLLDENQQVLAFNDDLGDDYFSRIIKFLEAGTYFIVVRGFSREVAAYTLLITETYDYHIYADGFEPDDTAAQATPINFGVPQTHTVESFTDLDWLVFTLDAPAEVDIITSGKEGDTFMTLRDADERFIVSNDDGGAGYFARITMKLERGTYFIVVEGFSGAVLEYTIEITADFTPPDAFEPDDVSEQANPIEPGVPQNSRNLLPEGDTDWVSFELAEESTVVIESLVATGPVTISLFVSGAESVPIASGHRIVDVFSAGLYLAEVKTQRTGEVVSDYGLKLTIDATAMIEPLPLRFERMWPTLQQPWYFVLPSDVTADGNGNIYITDTFTDRIAKFTTNGQLVTSWGRYGSGPGEFNFAMGITTDPSGNVYVTDRYLDRVQKFDSDGTFLRQWGSSGRQVGTLSEPMGIAADVVGNIYVADAGNHRVAKFSNAGLFLAQFGSFGTNGGGQFRGTGDVDFDSEGNLYITDPGNELIQVFNPDGTFLRQWSTPGVPGEPYPGFGLEGPIGIAVLDGEVIVAHSELDTVFKYDLLGELITSWPTPEIDTLNSGLDESAQPAGLAIDENRKVLVANQSIQRFSFNGEPVTDWASIGTDFGRMALPSGSDTDDQGFVYVADELNHRIQKFTSQGEFVRSWGAQGFADGKFSRPGDVAIGPDGTVYVADSNNDRIQKFTNEGAFIRKWGDSSTMSFPSAVVFDDAGILYVADAGNQQVQKFTQDGEFVDAWGNIGTVDGDFIFAFSLAIDSQDVVYASSPLDSTVLKFTKDGVLLSQWGGIGEEPGQLENSIGEIAVDAQDRIYVGDLHTIKMYTTHGKFLGNLGRFGGGPGEFIFPRGLNFGPQNRLHVSGAGANRMQILTPEPRTMDAKAIIVAAGGPIPGNDLWESTEFSANLAYRALTLQGIETDSIYYLSSDSDLDLNGDALADEVNGDASLAALEFAITDWAADADNLLLYIIGPGETNQIRLNATEQLFAAALDGWLDTFQTTTDKRVVTILDASDSGSFLDDLVAPANAPRANIASTSAGEGAFFVTEGTLSFSNHFWIAVTNGASLSEAFVSAREAVGDTVDFQHPTLDDSGDGLGNGKDDGAVLAGFAFLNETQNDNSLPEIMSISPDRTLELDEHSASFFADGVIDDDEAINRVWAVVTFSGDNKGGAGESVLELPGFELEKVSEGRYEGSFDEFYEAGEYNVDIYALDNNLNISKVLRGDVIVPAPIPAFLTGTVTRSDTGDAIRPATVTISTTSGLTVQTLQTGSGGLYLSGTLSKATYDVEANADGFTPLAKRIVITADGATTLNFQLVPDGGPIDPPPTFSCSGASSQHAVIQFQQVVDVGLMLAAALILFLIGRAPLSRSRATESRH